MKGARRPEKAPTRGALQSLFRTRTGDPPYRRARADSPRAPRGPRRRCGGRLVGQGSAAVVVDELDVVPVRVEHERAVVARVIDRALARRAMVLVARRERSGMERAHRGILARGEREVDVLREWPLVPDEREAVVRGGELHAGRLVVRHMEPGVRGDRRVEAPGGLRVADADPQVVDAAGGVRGPGAPSSRYPASIPACQNASTCARSRARKPTWSPRVTGCSRSVGPMSQSSHSTSSASAWLRSTPRTLRTVR